MSENKPDKLSLAKPKRNSNLELYRIIVMILIVAHHYVVNSGVVELIKEDAGSATSSALLLFGAWGKTAINCFVLITGYFMCKSKITWEKLLKLYLQITFYALIIYGIFCITGHETFSAFRGVKQFFPVKSIDKDFVSCFLLFFLLIPVLNILLQHIDKKLHLYLLGVLLGFYTILPSIPIVNIEFSFNYVGWFVTLYILASYIRNNEKDWKISHKQWGVLAIMSLGLACISILGIAYLYSRGYLGSYYPYFFIEDSNKILALLISVTSFMWFKGLKLSYSPFINLVGASTFGVLLIHANSNAMRKWLWQDTIDCIGHFGPAGETLIYATVSVIVIFAVCSVIEIFRIKFVEPHLMRWAKSFIKSFRNKNLKVKSISKV